MSGDFVDRYSIANNNKLAFHARILRPLGIDLHQWDRTTLALKRQDRKHSANVRYLP